jgi:tRNA(Ile2) C34 agmatinyltransferase TiaS
VTAGVVFVTVKVVCPGCGRRHWIAGRPTRLNCPFCGTAYFDEPAAAEKAG